MDKIIIIGTGANSAEIEEYLIENNRNGIKNEIIGFVSNDPEGHKKYQFQKGYLGKNIPDELLNQNLSIILGFTNVKSRLKVYKELKLKGLKFYNLIHYSARLSRTSKIGHGNIISPECQLGPNSIIGNINNLNCRANIGHDSVVGDNNIFCPNVGISGSCEIGNNNFFSVFSTTIPKIKCGNNNIIASGVIIDKNISDNESVFYRYKEKISFIPKIK